MWLFLAGSLSRTVLLHTAEQRGWNGIKGRHREEPGVECSRQSSLAHVGIRPGSVHQNLAIDKLKNN